MAEVGQCLFLPLLPTTSHKPSSGMCLPYTQRKEASLSPKTKECQEESKHRIYCFPQFTTISLDSLTYHISMLLPTLHQTQHKCSQFWVCLFLIFISLWRLPCHIKFILNKFISFSPANLFWAVKFSDFARDPKRVKENLFLSSKSYNNLKNFKYIF